MERYIIRWIPSADVQRIAEDHAQEMADGASVWDFERPEDIEREVVRKTEKGALSAAKRLERFDCHGEVHVDREILTDQRLAHCDWAWDCTDFAVVYDDTEAFDWISVEGS